MVGRAGVFRVGLRLLRVASLESTGRTASKSDQRNRRPPVLGQKILWVSLPACATVLLLATTNKLCQDMAVIPFLWILPLTLYLFSFVFCFDHPRWYVRPVFSFLLPPALAAICWAMFRGVDLELPRQIGIYLAGLFAGCMVCHGELSGSSRIRVI